MEHSPGLHLQNPLRLSLAVFRDSIHEIITEEQVATR